MAKNILVPLNLNKNELQNAVVQNLASAPSSPVEGQLYYDTAAHKLFWRSNSAWVDATGAAGAILASTLTTKGDLIVATASATAARQGVGADGTLLVANSGVANGLNWRVLADTDIPGTLARTSAIVPISTVTTKGDLIVATASGAVARQAAGANDTFLVADSAQTNGVKYRALIAADLQEKIATADLTDWPRVAALDLNSQKITSLADGTAATDAVTFQQLNAALNNQSWKPPADAITTGALPACTYANGTAGVGATLTENANGALPAQDGVTLAVGDTLLVANQAAPAQNGLYTVTALGSAGAVFVLTRRVDADTAAEITDATVLVDNGTTGKGDIYTFPTVTTMGTDSATPTKTGEGNTVYTSDGTTIELVGQSFRIAATAAGAGLGGGGASALSVNVDSTTIEISSDTLRVAATAAGNGLVGGGASALAVGAGTGITVAADTVSLDMAVATGKFSTNVGDGSSTSIVITHNLGTRDVQVQLYTNGTPWDTVECDVQRTTTNTVTLLFSTAPASNAYRAVVQG